MILENPYDKHELRSLEIRYRFMYLLRDIGIKSTNDIAVVSWLKYMECLEKIAASEHDCTCAAAAHNRHSSCLF